MLKKKLYTLLALFLGSVLIIFSLNALSNYMNNLPNDFNRKLPPMRITAKSVKDFKTDQIYIAGNTSDFIYIGNKREKNVISQLNLKSFDTLRYLISSSKTLKVSEAAHAELYSSGLYFFDGLRSNISLGSATNFELKEIYKTPTFTDVLPLSKNSFIVKSINSQNEYFMGKLNVVRKSLFQKNNFLKKQVDGLFCTDGMLVNLPGVNKFFYIYYYRNQFITADTNLNVIYTGKTIDTVSRAKITVSKIKSNNQLTMSSPPFYVNRRASANKTYLFIQSALKADNETDEMHNDAAAIDVYAIKDGEYQFSFYVPNFANKKLTDFKVYDQTLVALFGNYLYTFKLNF